MIELTYTTINDAKGGLYEEKIARTTSYIIHNNHFFNRLWFQNPGNQSDGRKKAGKSG